MLVSYFLFQYFNPGVFFRWSFLCIICVQLIYGSLSAPKLRSSKPASWQVLVPSTACWRRVKTSRSKGRKMCVCCSSAILRSTWEYKYTGGIQRGSQHGGNAAFISAVLNVSSRHRWAETPGVPARFARRPWALEDPGKVRSDRLTASRKDVRPSSWAGDRRCELLPERSTVSSEEAKLRSLCNHGGADSNCAVNKPPPQSPESSRHSKRPSRNKTQRPACGDATDYWSFTGYRRFALDPQRTEM